MVIKKSELYSSLWKSCDELRGGMDASQYKDYVLVLLFVKYVSDKFSSKKDALIEVPEGGSFKDMILAKGKPDIGDKLNKIIAKLAEVNGLNGVITVADFNDEEKLGKGKAMVDRLSNLISIFEQPSLDFSKNNAEGDDLLGDAYEYLMRHFATQSGKSKGQFYTPAEVSKIMAKLLEINKVKTKSYTVYDPTCGSGSLLLKAASEAENGLTIYGQEKDVATRALAVMNMWLHGNPDAEIWREDTISNPHFKNKDGSLKTFDFVVANPPFSTKSWSNGINPEKDEFHRFDGFGIPPKKNGDYAFLLHMVKSMKSTGKAAVILPHGVLFRGGSEARIRKNLIKRGYIKGIVGLPVNLFYGTGIPACIIVLDKENAENRKGIFIIDASKGFFKEGNKNRLRARDIHKIVNVFTNQLEIDKYSRMVSFEEIEKNEFNLNIPRYIDSQEEEDLHDIEAHLKGGIPNRDIDALENYWKVYPSLKNKLFVASERTNYSILNVDSSEIKKTIFEFPEFIDYSKKIELVFTEWKNKSIPVLKNITVGSKPKELINLISEELLSSFSKIELIDKYDIYQHLMDYWVESMQDDVYLISSNGWKIELKTIKNKKGKETGWDCDLLPKQLVIENYFLEEQTKINELESKVEEINLEMQSINEKNSGEEDLFSEARTNTGKITKKEITKRIKEIKEDKEFIDELKELQKYFELINKESELKNKIKETKKELDKKLLIKYKELTENEIKELVIEKKWLNSLHELVKSELEKISQKLASRIKELAERYEKPLPQLTKETEELTKKVENHLKEMGFEW